MLYCYGMMERANYSLLDLVPSFRLFMAGRERRVEWSGVRDGQAISIRDAVWCDEAVSDRSELFLICNLATG